MNGHCWAWERGIEYLAYHDVHLVIVCKDFVRWGPGTLGLPSVDTGFAKEACDCDDGRIAGVDESEAYLSILVQNAFSVTKFPSKINRRC